MAEASGRVPSLRPGVWVPGLLLAASVGAGVGVRLGGVGAESGKSGEVEVAAVRELEVAGGKDSGGVGGGWPRGGKPVVEEWGEAEGEVFGPRDGVLGRAYVPVSGGSVLPAAPEAVVVGVAPAGSSGGRVADSVGGGQALEEGSQEPAALRAPRPAPNPVAGLSVEDALRVPLLVERRGGDRLVFHALREGASRVPLVGEWAVVGECGKVLRMDMAQGGAPLGAVVGVGRGGGSQGEKFAVAVPVQACSVAGRRFQRPRALDVAERAVLVDGGAGVARGVIGGGGAWVATSDAVVGFERSEGGWRRRVGVQVSGAVLMGVLSSGSRKEGWFVAGDGSVISVRRVDGRWSVSEPGHLRDVG